MDAPRSLGQVPHKPLPSPPSTRLRTNNSDLYNDFAETDSDSSEKGSLSSSQQEAARRALWNKSEGPRGSDRSGQFTLGFKRGRREGLVRTPQPLVPHQAASSGSNSSEKFSESSGEMQVPNESAPSPSLSNIVIPPKGKIYELQEPTPGKMRKILEVLNRHPEFTEKYDFEILVVKQRGFELQFQGKKMLLNETDASNTASWKTKSFHDTRQSIVNSITAIKKPSKKHPNVNTLTAFHGTRLEYVASILDQGIRRRATTDPGFMGSGIYFAVEPQYSAMYGDKSGCVVFGCKLVSRGDLFPVVHDDKYLGQPLEADYDGHAAYVVPKDKSNPNEKWYRCVLPNEQKRFTEIVVSDNSYFKISWMIKCRLKEIYALRLARHSRKDLQNAIITYLRLNPGSDAFSALDSVLDNIKNSLDADCDAKELELLSLLQSALGKGVSQRLIVEKIHQFLQENYSIDGLTGDLPAGYVAKQEEQELVDDNIRNADQLYKQKKYEQALQAYKKSKESLHSFRAYLGCGKAANKLNDLEEAITNLETALRFKKDDSKARSVYSKSLRKRAQKFIEQGQYAEAEGDLRKAIEFDRSNLAALALHAKLLFSQDCFKRACLSAERALATDPDYFPALRMRGIIYFIWGKNFYAQAEKDLSKSLELEKKPNPLALTYRAYLYIASERLREAQRDCDLLLESDPDNIDGYIIRAKIALLQKDTKKAEKDLQICNKKSPNDFLIFGLMGDLFLQRNDLANALKKLNQSVELFKQLLGQDEKLELKKLKHKDYVDFYGILLTRAKAHYQSYIAKGKGNFLELTSADYNEAIKLFPDKPEAYLSRAAFYEEMGDQEKAKADRSKAAELENVSKN